MQSPILRNGVEDKIIKTFLISDSIVVIVEDIISLSVALLNIIIKLKPNVSFFVFQRIHPPEFFKKKYAVDEVHYVTEVSCLCL